MHFAYRVYLQVLYIIRINSDYIGFEVLTAVVMKSFTFWDIALSSPLNVNQYLRGICGFHLQGRKISQAGKPA
jgi:hypothetical protein